MAAERLCIRARPLVGPLKTSRRGTWRRAASTTATATSQTDDPDIEYSSFSTEAPSEEQLARFSPFTPGQRKDAVLGRHFQFKAPRYYRGPLHPVQPPRPSDPISREFRPGPFSLPRLEQTYHATLAHDLMTIYYEHVPPGTPKPPPKERLRPWVGESPFLKGRPLRPPRGDPDGQLGLLRKPINWNNVPKLNRITVSARVLGGAESTQPVHTAGMVLQALTGVRATMIKARRSTGQATTNRNPTFQQKVHKPIAVLTDLYGEDMWHFMSTLTSIVMPKIKDFTGVRGRAGDGNGNLQIGISPDLVGSWPEIAVNYDMYPPEMIPGIGITLHTTARSDRDMRLLMASLGIPFLGNHRTRGP